MTVHSSSPLRSIRRSRRRPLCAALSMLLGLPAAQAATILVDSSADGSVAARCTLRDAVAAANTDAAVAGCAAGSGTDTIRFAPDVASITLTAANGGSLLVTGELILDGQGRPVTVRREAGDATFRIIETEDTAPLVLRWMKITGGRLDEQDMNRGGAGVLARADLTLENSEISSNVTNKLWGRGAGILAHAGLELIDSVVSGNAATGESSSGGGVYSYYQSMSLTRSVVSGNATLGTASQGGGIGTRSGIDVVATDSTIADNWTSGPGSFGGGFHVPLGTVTLTNSTISGNATEGDNAWGGGGYAYAVRATGSTVSGNSTLGYASYGGGLMAATMDVSNSTISGNRTAAEHALGGGLVVVVDSTIRNSTIFGNRADQSTGGGVLLWSGDPAVTLTLESSLVFSNQATADADVGSFDPSGQGATSLIAGSHNLIGASSSTAAFPPDTLDCDPLLMPLAANGGRTLTHRLGEGSCAIDAGANPDALASDQRGAGYQRRFGDGVDIGAFERQPADEKIFADGFDPG